MKKNLIWFGIAFFVIAFIFKPAPILAGDPSGTWTSSSGSTIKLWANMQQVLVTVVTPDGQTFKWNGWWTRFSDQFAYNTNNGTNYASFANSDQINVKDSSGTWFVWTRGSSVGGQFSQPQQSGTQNISGNWHSSSGAYVQISDNGNQVVVNIVGTNGQRSQGIGRWLQPGYRFDYSIAGYPGVADCTILSKNKIKVLYNGKPTFWSR
ncbi:MAG: hypothetical protein ACOYXC_03195 [Candidatus Rifleibacteriota bacterium]